MQNDEKLINALILDNVNVSQDDPLKEMFKILFQLFCGAVIVYFVVFLLSGFVLKNLSLENQIELENFISSKMNVKTLSLPAKEQERLNAIKEDILANDFDFPKTSNLEINVIENKEPNAICYPNGNIYITTELYKKLKTDEQLTFVLAHEMAHYRNKDHLMKLRQNISSMVVLTSMIFISPDMSALSETIGLGMELSDMKLSRKVEAKADKYAGKTLMDLYGTTQGGIEVLETLSKDKIYMGEVFSSHPAMEKRIKYLKSLNY